MKPQVLARTSSAGLYSFGPYVKPSSALKDVARWMKEQEQKLEELSSGHVPAIEDVRLSAIGHTWWVVVHEDTASMVEKPSRQEMSL